jgi:hypothetical protein
MSYTHESLAAELFEAAGRIEHWPSPATLQDWATKIRELGRQAARLDADLATARAEVERMWTELAVSNDQLRALQNRPLKLLGYANAFRIKQTCADKPGGAHLGQVAIYSGESVDPMEIQERDNPTWMGEPVLGPFCYSCGCQSDRPRNWMGRSICSKCAALTPKETP